MSLDILILFITEFSYFYQEMKVVFKTFHQKSIFVKFQTIPPKKDEQMILIIP